MTKVTERARFGGGRKLAALLAVAAASSALPLHAATWTCYPEITNGMTGPEQITNALTQLASGDTILVKPGTYDFTGISMRTDNFTSGGVTYVITNHLTRNINFTLKGDTSGHWDDSVVFTGDGRCCDLKNYKKYCNFYNITFDGFDCNRYPSGGSFESRGGALRLEDNSTYDIVSNCVIRNCSAYIGGAVNGGVLVDCLCTNNYSSSNGGAGSNTRFERCRVVFNRAGGSYGGSYSHYGIFDTYFEGNTAYTGGAVLHGRYMCISNSTFVANVTRNVGGAIYVDSSPALEIADCTFVGNVATNAGGAIYISAKDSPKVRNCTFVSNSVATVANTYTTYGGGAIYSSTSSEANTISNCTFVGNWTERNYGGAVVNGVYEDCTFISNCVKTVAHGGAGYFLNPTGAVRRCVFFDNMAFTNGYGGALCANARVPVVDSAFTNNYAWTFGGAVHKGFCTNCIFSGNMVVYRGGALSEGEAVDCVFRGNRKGDRFGRTTAHDEFGGGCAYKSSLIRCDTTDGAFWKCSLLDCNIHDFTSGAVPACIFYEENWATNCLVSGCSTLKYGMFYRYLYRPGGASDYRGAIRGSMVNCTFADNAVATDGIFGFNGVHKTNDFDFVNCIFHNNKVKSGAVADLSGALAPGVTLQNCLYGVSDGTHPWEDKGGNIVCADPMFAKNIRDGRYPYYMPKSGSPAIDAGLAQDWMSTASDLSGTNRVLNARVDIGCYESCIPAFGTVIVFQ